MKKLFETKKIFVRTNNGTTTVGTPGAPDTQIFLLKAFYIQTLATNFRQYPETILFSSKVLRMGIQKTPYQKTYELQTGVQEWKEPIGNLTG